MGKDLIQVCHNGYWQPAQMLCQDNDGVIVMIEYERYVYIANGSWGLLF